jgi:hypothetical protein
MKIKISKVLKEMVEVDLPMPQFRKMENNLYKFYQVGESLKYDTICCHSNGRFSYMQQYGHCPEYITYPEATIEEYSTALQAFLKSVESDLNDLYEPGEITKKGTV